MSTEITRNYENYTRFDTLRRAGFVKSVFFHQKKEKLAEAREHQKINLNYIWQLVKNKFDGRSSPHANFWYQWESFDRKN